MRYRWFIFMLALLLPLPAAGQNQIRVHWERYDTLVDIQSDGSMRVEEQQVLVVDRGPLRRMNRTFTTGDKGRVRNIEVFEDGQRYRRGAEQPGTYSGTDTGQNAEIQLWFLDPAADRHAFTIAYTVDTALVAQAEQATLDWAFFWGDANAPQIQAGSVEIRFPQQVNPSELRLDAGGAPARLVSQSNPVRWELTEPVQGTELNVQAAFPRAVLAVNATFRSAQGAQAPNRPIPADPASRPNSAPVPGAAPAGSFDIVFCLIVLLFLFIAFSIIRASARSRRRQGSPGSPPALGSSPDFGADPLGPLAPRRRRRRYGGWGGWTGGFFPPIIITPPSPPRDHSGPLNSPFDGGSPFGDSGGSSSGWGDSGGSSSGWGDSGGSGSSWGDSGGSGSSWNDMGGGSSSWGGGGGGGGGDNDRGGSGGGSFG